MFKADDLKLATALYSLIVAQIYVIVNCKITKTMTSVLTIHNIHRLDNLQYT